MPCHILYLWPQKKKLEFKKEKKEKEITDGSERPYISVDFVISNSLLSSSQRRTRNFYLFHAVKTV